MSSVGINVAAVDYWGTEDPFLDRFRNSSNWHVGNSATLAPVDQNGNPTGIVGSEGFLSVMVGILPASQTPSDEYVLTYSGTGQFELPGVKVLSSTPGRIVFDASTITENTGTQLKLWADSATDPVHDIHIVRADQVDLYNSGEIFNPAFVEKASQWDVIRFMDWTNTNDSLPVSWATHSQASSASWSSIAANDGVPLEVMVKLANEAHTDMWYNVPSQADDTYVANAMAYIRDNLDPSLKVHVEYSNEVWNWGMNTSHYAQSQATALWGHDTNGDGTINPNDPTESPHNWMEYYGYRSAQVAAIAHQVFGDEASSRLSDVLSGQAAYAALTSYYTVEGVALANVGSVSSLFSEYAITTYFGNELDGGTAADQATVLSWARSGQAGIDAAFQEMEHGGLLQSDASLDGIVASYQQQAEIARQYGMDLVAYEGGAHLTAAAFSSDVQDEVAAFFGKLMDDPRMGDLYAKMVEGFTAAGGDTLLAYNDVGTNSRYGYWGILDSIYDDGSPRYDALLAAAQQGHVVSQTPTIGAADADALTATATGGALNGLGGNDTLTAGAGSDMISGGDGDDIIYGRSKPAVAGAANESDYYFGDGGADTIIGGAGSDHIYGNNSAVAAGSVDGADSLMGGDGNDYVQGNAGNDTIDGGAGNDRLYGGADADSVSGGDGWDYVQGNKGMDTLLGGAGNDTVHGGADNDQLFGGDGGDQLFGDAGNDMLSGGDGIDTLAGGAGFDTLTGGAGGDFFLFSGTEAVFTQSGADAWRTDEITDFTDHVDRIGLSFHVAGVAQGSSYSEQAAAVVGQGLLLAHAGHSWVAAVSVGNDTYLFYDGDGTGGLADSAIKVDNVQASVFDTLGLDFI